MEFGVALPGRGPMASPDQVLKIAAKADALGYASIFVTDHVVLPASMARSVYPYSTTGQLPGGAAQDYLEPLAMLACLARVTKRAQLGTSVLVIPYRHPVLTAKMLATIDQLAGGRVLLGIGVGWLREEFEALGTPPFEQRGIVTDEYVRLMRTAWTTDPVTFAGRYVSVRDVHVLPKPVAARRHPGVGRRSHRRRASAARPRSATAGTRSGCAPRSGLRPRSTRRARDAFTRWPARPDAIRSRSRCRCACRWRCAPGRPRPRPVTGRSSRARPSEVTADIRAYAAVGVTHFVFDSTHQDMSAVLANMERFAKDVMPGFAPRARRPAKKARVAPRKVALGPRASGDHARHRV